MHCPACDQTLRPLKTGTVMLDVCHDCGGIWFDHRELEKVNADHPNADDVVADFTYNPLTRVDENRARPCPRCDGVTLEKKLYDLGSGVIMDRCPQCKGIWLDQGELEKIRESIRPRPRHRRGVIRKIPTQNVALGADVLQQVQILHRGPRPRS
jgi:Zn-finger nucleic acid-binding protein